MGRAIVRQPAVFLFDEPLSNLDARLRVEMRSEIAKLQRRLGTTTVYVTHDQVEAMTLATRIVVMSQGSVQQVGKPLELYRSPVNRFVAGFIGSPSMSFLPVSVVDGGLRGTGFRLPLPKTWRLEASDPGDYLLGVRPEHVSGAVYDDNPGLPLRVDVLEPLGARVHAVGTCGGHPMTAELPPDTPVRVGEVVRLRVDMGEVHLFDAATGERRAGPDGHERRSAALESSGK